MKPLSGKCRILALFAWIVASKAWSVREKNPFITIVLTAGAITYNVNYRMKKCYLFDGE